MAQAGFLQAWSQLVQSFAILGIIVTALSLMLGIKRSEVLKYVGTILGIAIALILIPTMLANVWANLSLWQQIAAAAIGIAALRLLRPRPKPRK